MENWSTILFQILDGIIKIVVPIAATVFMNYLAKRLSRERFLLAKDVIGSIVSTLEQQYRTGEIPKDDRFSLAMETGLKKTGLTEEQVAQLIKEAVFLMNVQLGKYSYNTAQGFLAQGNSAQVIDGTVQGALPVNTGNEVSINSPVQTGANV
ncbi:MAG TPA: hypothetical protein VNU93_03990 [Verrucomicrobiae bacterium]|nr:hypothetical protein [Verrucomicrobiae bacterium]